MLSDEYLIEGQQCESELKTLILRNYDIDENQEDGVSSGVGTKLEDLIYNWRFLGEYWLGRHGERMSLGKKTCTGWYIA